MLPHFAAFLHQRGEIIRRRFRPANQAEIPRLGVKHLRPPQAAVVLIAHARAVGSGIVNNQQIAQRDLGQRPVHREFIVVFAQARPSRRMQ